MDGPQGEAAPAHQPSMPYVGIPSFVKLPILAKEDLPQVDFAVLGVPYDEGTSNRPGARFGPRAIRAASTLYSYEGSAELFDVELGRTILKGARIGDAGDVDIRPGAGEANRKAIVRSVRGVLEAGALPVCLGGDHSITASILRAWRPAEPPRPSAAGETEHPIGRAGLSSNESPPAFLVHLDTHMDFDSYLPRHAHGTPVRIAVEDGLVAGAAQIGLRGLNSGEADWREAQERGVRVMTAADVRRAGTRAVLDLVPPGAALYLSVDIDAFDPSIAPGTGTPEPGGLSYQEGREILRLLAGHGPVVGLDLVEVNPQYDHGEITAVLAARLLLDVMGAIWEARGGGSEG